MTAVVVRGKNVSVSRSLKALVDEKLARIERIVPGLDRATVDFTETGHHHSPRVTECEITVYLPRNIVRAHAQGADATSALDVTVDKLEHRVARLKDKRVTRLHGRTRRGGGDGAVAPEAAAADAVDPLDLDARGEGPDHDSLHIVREKRFDAKPMVPEEAAMQMALLDHDFFLFTNAENGRAAVIYRRRDGHLGLIETSG